MGFIKLKDGNIIHTSYLPVLTNDKMETFPYNPDHWKRLKSKLDNEKADKKIK